MAWWQAVPKKPPSKNPKVVEPVLESDKLSRMQRRINGGGDIDLPFVEPEFRIIIDYLFDVGPVSNGGMGPVPLSWLDLDVWQRNIGISLSPWILRLLRELSGTYILESKRSEAEDAPPPWNVVPDRQKVAGHIKKLFRG